MAECKFKTGDILALVDPSTGGSNQIIKVSRKYPIRKFKEETRELEGWGVVVEVKQVFDYSEGGE